MAQTNIKLGYIRDPESHEMYFPYTHYLGVVGLDEHVYDLIGGSVDNYIPLSGSNAITGSLIAATNGAISLGDASHNWQHIYTNDIVNNNTTFTKHSLTLNNASTPLSFLANSDISFYAPVTIGNAGQFLKVNSGANGFDYGNIYSKSLSYTINGETATTHNIFTDTDSNITLSKFYAPETGGSTANQLLLSLGSNNAPIWSSLSSSGWLKWSTSGLTTLQYAWNLYLNANWSGVHQGNALPSSGSSKSVHTLDVPQMFQGNGIVFKEVLDGNDLVSGYSINASEGLADLSTYIDNYTTDTGYLERYLNTTSNEYEWRLGSATTTVYNFTVKNNGTNVNEFDPDSAASYVDVSMVHSNGTGCTQESTTSSNKAGFKVTNGTNTYFQKISFAAIENDAATGNDAVTIILNGNFN